MVSACLVLMLVAADPARTPESIALHLQTTPTPVRGVPRAWGPLVEARARISPHAFAAATLRVTRFWSANDYWQLPTTGVGAHIAAGVDHTRGVARMFADLQVGVEGLFEHKIAQKNDAVWVAGRPRSTWRWSVGPLATAEVGVEIAFWDTLGLAAAAGPAMSIHKIAGEGVFTVGLHSRLGLVYAF